VSAFIERPQLNHERSAFEISCMATADYEELIDRSGFSSFYREPPFLSLGVGVGLSAQQESSGA